MQGFSQQVLQMTTRVLQLVKRGFDAFPDAGQQGIKGWDILHHLVGAFGRPNPVAPGTAHLSLPSRANKAFIGKNVTALHSAQHALRREAFIGIGGNQ